MIVAMPHLVGATVSSSTVVAAAAAANANSNIQRQQKSNSTNQEFVAFADPYREFSHHFHPVEPHGQHCSETMTGPIPPLRRMRDASASSALWQLPSTREQQTYVRPPRQKYVYHPGNPSCGPPQHSNSHYNSHLEHQLAPNANHASNYNPFMIGDSTLSSSDFCDDGRKWHGPAQSLSRKCSDWNSATTSPLRFSAPATNLQNVHQQQQPNQRLGLLSPPQAFLQLPKVFEPPCSDRNLSCQNTSSIDQLSPLWMRENDRVSLRHAQHSTAQSPNGNGLIPKNLDYESIASTDDFSKYSYSCAQEMSSIDRGLLLQRTTIAPHYRPSSNSLNHGIVPPGGSGLKLPVRKNVYPSPSSSTSNHSSTFPCGSERKTIRNNNFVRPQEEYRPYQPPNSDNLLPQTTLPINEKEFEFATPDREGTNASIHTSTRSITPNKMAGGIRRFQKRDNSIERGSASSFCEQSFPFRMKNDTCMSIVVLPGTSDCPLGIASDHQSSSTDGTIASIRDSDATSGLLTSPKFFNNGLAVDIKGMPLSISNRNNHTEFTRTEKIEMDMRLRPSPFPSGSPQPKYPDPNYQSKQHPKQCQRKVLHVSPQRGQKYIASGSRVPSRGCRDQYLKANEEDAPQLRSDEESVQTAEKIDHDTTSSPSLPATLHIHKEGKTLHLNIPNRNWVATPTKAQQKSPLRSLRLGSVRLKQSEAERSKLDASSRSGKIAKINERKKGDEGSSSRSSSISKWQPSLGHGDFMRDIFGTVLAERSAQSKQNSVAVSLRLEVVQTRGSPGEGSSLRSEEPTKQTVSAAKALLAMSSVKKRSISDID